jgi:hypothetical protein
MKDTFDELWQEREEMLKIEEKKDPFCTCDEYGEDACSIHSTLDLETLSNEDIEKITKNKNKKGVKKNRKTSLEGMQKNHQN